MAGGMGERRQAGDVADGIDAAVAGAEALVDHDAVRLVLDAGGLQIERIDVRPPADRHQQIGALDGFLGVAGQHDLDPLAQPPHPLDLDAAADRDALARERIEHDGRRIPGLPCRVAAPASSTVTSEPSRRNACASSSPTGPPPSTIRCFGRSRISNAFSLVR